MPKSNKAKQSVPVFHFAFRLSVIHTAAIREALVAFLRTSFGADKYIFQAEKTVHEGKDNPHYQGYFHVKEKTRVSTLISICNKDEGFRGMQLQPASTAGTEALKKYVMKEDTRVAGPWADKAIYMGADLWSPCYMPVWQRQLTKYLSGPPNDRYIIWINDPAGNQGKSKFLKYLAYHHDALNLTYGKSGDLLNLVSKNQGRRCYSVNLSRTRPESVAETELYAGLEGIKDGHFTNTKYETNQVLMNSPHLVVMANHPPVYANMSNDRWVVFNLTDGQLLPACERGAGLLHAPEDFLPPLPLPASSVLLFPFLRLDCLEPHPLYQRISRT